MLGKASEIQINYISDIEHDFQKQLDLFIASHLNAEIIDIKFTVTSLEDFADQPHVLIIYKEAE